MLIQMPPHPNLVTLKKEAVYFREISRKLIVLCKCSNPDESNAK